MLPMWTHFLLGMSVSPELCPTSCFVDKAEQLVSYINGYFATNHLTAGLLPDLDLPHAKVTNGRMTDFRTLQLLEELSVNCTRHGTLLEITLGFRYPLIEYDLILSETAGTVTALVSSNSMKMQVQLSYKEECKAEIMQVELVDYEIIEIDVQPEQVLNLNVTSMFNFENLKSMAGETISHMFSSERFSKVFSDAACRIIYS